jgi:hypothetical protein
MYDGKPRPSWHQKDSAKTRITLTTWFDEMTMGVPRDKARTTPSRERPGRMTFADVTLERGATQNRDLFDWFQDVAITSSGLGLNDDLLTSLEPLDTWDPATLKGWLVVQENPQLPQCLVDDLAVYLDAECSGVDGCAGNLDACP